MGAELLHAGEAPRVSFARHGQDGGRCLLSMVSSKLSGHDVPIVESRARREESNRGRSWEQGRPEGWEGGGPAVRDVKWEL